MRLKAATIIAAILCLGIGSATPQPRRADSVAKSAGQAKQDRSDKQAPAGHSVPVVNPAAASNPSEQRPAVATPDKQQTNDQSVTVQSLPSLNVPRDWVDYSQVILTVVVLGLAIWQIVLLTQTVKATETAANAAAMSANVARDALYLLEGANIQLQESILDIPEKPISPMDALWNAVLTLKWRNYGRSMAKDFVPDINLGLENMPVRNADQQTPVVVAPGQTVSYGYRKLGEYFSPDEMNLVLAGTVKLCFWGTIKYSDVFGQSTTLEIGAEWVHGTNAFKWTKQVETRIAPQPKQGQPRQKQDQP